MTQLPDSVTIRALTTRTDFERVVELERTIWGYSDMADAVGAPMLIVTVKRGGILLGAFDGDRMIGFVYSFAGLKAGKPMQWSHMLGVVDEFRSAGIGRLLKLEQRRAALGMGLDLVEWTFDPLQAVNAHLNFRRLGVTVNEYALNVYGDSPSPLHRGTPTDRFIAQWAIRSSRVERAIALDPMTGQPGASAQASSEPAQPRESGHRTADGSRPGARTSEVAPFVNTASGGGEWLEPEGLDLGRSDPELLVTIPFGFTEMLINAPDLARAWRHHTREVFLHYLSRGYTVVDFVRDADVVRGHYRLTACGLRPTA